MVCGHFDNQDSHDNRSHSLKTCQNVDISELGDEDHNSQHHIIDKQGFPPVTCSYSLVFAIHARKSKYIIM